MKKDSPLELSFLYFWRTLAPFYPEPVLQYRFAAPRRWRFDFAWIDQKLAVEVEGGIYSQGRHIRPQGYIEDIEKYNVALMLKWRIYRVTGPMLQNDPATMIDNIIQLLEPHERTQL
jgi:very-short-patch-repair endonuclease